MNSEERIEASGANGAPSHGSVAAEGILVSAANAALSTAPATPEGKACSARDSTRREALASSVLLGNESREAFLDLLNETCETLDPHDNIECQLVVVAVVNHWRRMRIWCLESAELTHRTRIQERGAGAEAIAENQEIPSMSTAHAFHELADKSRVLDVLKRYEIGNSREYTRALSMIQSERARRARLAERLPRRERR